MTAGAIVAAAVTRWRAETRISGDPARPRVVGLCGPPGAGKSSIGRAMAATGERVATLSLDDLYFARAVRARRAAAIHPLLATRGVPGTHDVALGVDVLARLVAGERVALPRFDKAADAPRPIADWPVVDRIDVVLFEGWCLGAVPQPDADLATPVNTRERDDDPDGAWRRFVNAELAGQYAALFALVDRLILLRAPDFATVVTWRQAAEADNGDVMSAAEIVAFLATYERLTRWIDAEMPARADLTLDLDAGRTVVRSSASGDVPSRPHPC